MPTSGETGGGVPARPEEIASIIARCLDHLEEGRLDEIESLCAAHPESAATIRRRIGILESTGLLDEPFATGPYRPLYEIGHGGQARVYLAEDRRLRRLVALKVLSGTGSLSGLALRRFRREAELTSRLDHPGICTVYDAGAEGGTSWIAMRYVPGETLAQKIRRARPDSAAEIAREATPRSGGDSTELERSRITTRAGIQWVLEVVERVARALHDAHEHGIVHRDVKSGNVMITPAGDPVILDFGLAAVEDDASGKLTQSGDTFGTPPYMSPEQIRPQGATPDRRSDVYSLAVTLYECLTLRLPFEAATREGLQYAILEEEPPDPRRFNPAIPPELRIVLETALAKDRDHRYRTALEFAEELRRVRDHEPIRTRRAGRIRRAMRWSQRHPARAALALVLMLGIPLVAGLAGFIFAHLPAIDEQRVRARRERIEQLVVDGYAELAEGDPERARASFEGVAALEADNAEAAGGLALAWQRLGRHADALGVLDAARGAAAGGPAFAHMKATSLFALGRPDEARSLLSAAGPPQDALGCFLVGVALMQAAHGTEDAQPAFVRARGLLERAVLMTSPARQLFHFELAHVAGHAGEAAPARAVADAIIALWPQSALALDYAGFALRRSEPAAAEDLLRRAVQLDPRLSRAHFDLAHVVNDRGRPDEALAAYHDALRADPGSAQAWYCIGHLQSQLDRRAEAKQAYARAIGLRPSYAEALHNLGTIHHREKDHAEAIACYRRALALRPDEARIHHSLGMALDAAGEPEEAIVSLRRAVGIDARRPDAWHRLGVILDRQKRTAEALAAFEGGLAADPAHASSLFDHSRMLTVLHRHEESVVSLRRALALQPEKAEAWSALGESLREIGLFGESLDAYRQALEQADPDAKGRGRLAKDLRDAELLASLEDGWLKLLAEDRLPAQMVQCAALARAGLARRRFEPLVRVLPRAIAHFENAPPIRTGLEVLAARAAAGASAADGLDAEAAQSLRARAARWLESVIAIAEAGLESGRQRDESLLGNLRCARGSPELAPMGDPATLARLPAAEQESWRALWKRLDDAVAERR